jgi:hypothetical protein
LTVTDICDESRAELNDTKVAGGSVYTDAVLLPYAKKAWLELQNKYIEIGIPYPQAISAPIAVNAGALTLTSPSDFILSIQLRERTPGDPTWIPMYERQWESDDPQQSVLGVWAFRDGVVYFRGATSNREVKLYYYKSFALITAASSTIPYLEAKSCLAARIAALAARYIGGMPERADALDQDAMVNLDMLLGSKVRKMQSLPVRRMPYKFRGAVRRRPWTV